MGEIKAEDAAKFQGTSPAPGSKVTVMLRIPEPLAAQWPEHDEGSPPHFTLLFVGEVPDDKRSEFLVGVAAEVLSTAAFDVELAEGVSWFTSTGEHAGQEVAHKAVVDSAPMAELHGRLREVAEDLDIDVAHVGEGFKAHATLAILDEREYPGPVPEGSFRAGVVEVWGYPEDYVFPLAPKVVVAKAAAPPPGFTLSLKLNDERREATGVLAKAFDGTSDSLDTDGEALTAEDVLTLARSFMLQELIAGHDDNHDRLPHNRRLVEIFVNDDRVQSPLFPADAAVATMHYPEDEDWALVKSGQRAGFSFDAGTIPGVREVEILVRPVEVVGA